MANPTRCTPEVTKRICQLVAAGAPLPHAAPACGVPWDTVKKWNVYGKEGKEPFATFVAEVQQAKAAFAVGAAMAITKASKKDWRASAYLLERRHPKQYYRQREAPAVIAPRVDLPLNELVKLLNATSSETSDPPPDDDAA